MKRKTLSMILLAAGAVLLVVGFLNVKIPGFVTVKADSTGPVWMLDGHGNPTLSPKNGDIQNSPLTSMVAGVYDPETGIGSIVATIDSYQISNFTLTTGDSFSGAIYAAQINFNATSGSSHTVTYTATNDNGDASLSTSYSGSFTISTGAPPTLTGTWKVNGVSITSPNQVVHSNSLSITFEFDKISGPADNTIVCTIMEGSPPPILTLANNNPGVWVAGRSFTGGVHVLTLTATATGQSPVTMELAVNFGGASINFSQQQILFMVGGAGLMGVGGYLGFSKRRR